MSRRINHWPAFLAESPVPWIPSADVYRTPDGWLLKFDLAGVRLEDVTVSIKGCFVSLSGVRRDSVIEQGCSHYAMEISYNRFERSIEMPADLENARVSLEARDGLLLVRVITEGKKHV
jgi:HSP20 family protein